MSLQPSQRFCSSCGASLKQAGVPQSNTPADCAIKEPKSWRRLFGLAGVILIALALFAVGIQSMALGIAGKPATAGITSHRQSSYGSGSRNSDPNRYTVHYVFYVDGQRYTGSTTRIFKYGIRSNQTIAVRYMPGMPGINAAENDTKIITGPVMIGLVLLILIPGIRGHMKHSKRTKA